MPTPRLSHRTLVLIPVAALHAVVIAVLVSAMGQSSSPVYSNPSLVTIFLRPTIRDDDGTPSGPDLSMLAIPVESSLQGLDIPSLAIANETSRNSGATIAAPSLRPDSGTNLAPFVAQAALRPGEGATVVLRIHVLPTGEPGDIEVDGSSGSNQVDQAAIDYARTLRWYSGRVGNDPEAMWIRWGVRLQA
jgi:TonB family protein